MSTSVPRACVGAIFIWAKFFQVRKSPKSRDPCSLRQSEFLRILAAGGLHTKKGWAMRLDVRVEDVSQQSLLLEAWTVADNLHLRPPTG